MRYVTCEAYATIGVETINKLRHSKQLFKQFARTNFINYMVQISQQWTDQQRFI